MGMYTRQGQFPAGLPRLTTRALRRRKMPTLKLTSLPKKIQLLNITAVMCFPSDKDEDQRRYWSLRHWIGVAADKFVQIGEQDGYSEDLSKQIGSWLGDVIHHVGSWPALANAVIGPRQKKPPAAEARFYMECQKIQRCCSSLGCLL